jgi:signal transduction histidine kinase
MDSLLSDDLAAVARIPVVPGILDVVSRTTGMGFVAIARVTEDRWMACAVRDKIDFGLEPGGELEIHTTLCNEIRQSGHLVVIDHVALDVGFRDHPTPRMYGFQSYISVPIFRPNGEFFGTLCAIDVKPARVNVPETVGMFRLFADLIGFHLDSQDRLAASEAALLDANQAAELREQFIAVLGHDLRSPLASIDAGARLMARTSRDDRTKAIAGLIERGVSRMAGLIDNVLDFSRGRLGGGIPVVRTLDERVGEALLEVVAEFRSAQPERTIDVDIAVAAPVYCDCARIAQLFSNLLGNALTHGATDAPVQVRARTGNDVFELAVTNGGPAIPLEAAQHIFQPFKRTSPGEQGLGLGLFIASEIARAHGARLEFESDPGRTRFVLRMPLTETGWKASRNTAAVPPLGPVARAPEHGSEEQAH